MMGTKNNPGKYDCYDKAEPDEPMFVLLARDPVASTLVRIWILISRGMNKAKFAEAEACADAMDTWRIAQQTQGRFTED